MEKIITEVYFRGVYVGGVQKVSKTQYIEKEISTGLPANKRIDCIEFSPHFAYAWIE